MIARLSWTITVSLAALCSTGCAGSTPAQEPGRDTDQVIAAILSVDPDEARYGETKRCLSDVDFRNFRALDDQHILFEGRHDELWVNTLRMHCPDLRYATALRVRSYGSISRICDGDGFLAGDWFDWPWYRRWPWHWGATWYSGVPCALGKFQPVTADQVAAIEAAVRAR